ncbi:porphobilinogen deaminase, putative (PBGD) [Plasmodium ovale wallikeri]|uniref:hydroxymethylbilane synthase n=1 Tax=Plasmodium ovale wallikeri TaxID=864142 RepID=A0A1A8YHL4_PLAOA|nr:porphobilinogen deaminase, putative (PBGD) [Plasmodium ovale wallikeri]
MQLNVNGQNFNLFVQERKKKFYLKKHHLARACSSAFMYKSNVYPLTTCGRFTAIPPLFNSSHVHISSNSFINVHNLGHEKNRELTIKKNSTKSGINNHTQNDRENTCTRKKKLCLVQANKEIIIGTRDSPLAIKQSEKVKKKLLAYFKKIHQNVKVTLKPIKTTGDKILDKNVGLFGGKGIFTKELDEQLLKNNVHMCVHSLKDIPTVLPENIHVACFLKRDTINDVFLSIKYRSLTDMNKSKTAVVGVQNDHIIPNDTQRQRLDRMAKHTHTVDEQSNHLATVATSSLRRKSQIGYAYKNIKLKSIRGNINTRIAKVFNGYCDAIVIALCGLERLMSKKIVRNVMNSDKSSMPSKSYVIGYNNTNIDLNVFHIQKINTKIIYPALCQGIIAVTSNKKNVEISQILKNISDEKSEIMANIERTFLQIIEGNCMMPIGGYTKFLKSEIHFNAIINDIHGYEKYQVKEIGHVHNYHDIAIKAVTKIKEKMGTEKFNKIKDEAALYYT